MNAVYKRQDRVVTREIAGEVLLVPIHGDVADMNYLFMLNPVSAHIWQRLDGATPVSAIVESVCETFEVDPTQAEQDTSAFLDDLLSSNLLTRVEP
ncbi:MAG TPA: PqqD family protein [Candidatus Competibacter sp.]|nr:PqqD family protein [Candidatus Competibacteraceae bacterium]HPE71531.1 PqqD family protein [Candidatus Competibacter sp.]HRW64489.1 PqqD family protein [Candidatus Competibacter sp.]